MDYGGGGDYSTTSYGAQGGTNGGGFMPGSQESPYAKRDYTKDSLRPVTIRQVNLAEQVSPDSDTCTLDGAECTQITLVGQVMNVSHQATNVMYRVDDGTGQIDVKFFKDQDVDTEDPNSMLGKIKQDMYIRVHGRIKVYGKKMILAHMARPIPDMMEREYHMLECTAVHLFLTRGPAGGGGEAKANGTNGMSNGMSDDKSASLRHLSPTARKVYECLNNTPQMNEGMHLQDIATRLSIPTGQVLAAGEELIDAALTYATADDHTWAVA